jgi:hypothetical protein
MEKINPKILEIKNIITEKFPASKKLIKQDEFDDEIYVIVEEDLYETKDFQDFIISIKLDYLLINGISNVFFVPEEDDELADVYSTLNLKLPIISKGIIVTKNTEQVVSNPACMPFAWAA